jgi:ABC-2 type transport system ATP-binding protein
MGHCGSSFKMKNQTVLKLNDVSHSYGAGLALKNVSFEVKSGCCTILLGPNGAGKTTLFSLIARLLPLRSGSIFCAGQNLIEAPNEIMSQVGIVFQQQTLDLDLTVDRNLTYYAALHGISRAITDRKIVEVLTKLDLLDKRQTKVRLLNGGHRRRVEIARALLTDPKLLLLDEPTVGLDIPTRRALVDVLHELAVVQDTAILWATHISDEVRDGDDVLVLSKGTMRASGTLKAVLSASSTKNIDDAFVRLTHEN